MAPVGDGEQRDPRNEPRLASVSPNQGWCMSTGGELSRQSRGIPWRHRFPQGHHAIKSKGHDSQPGQHRLPTRLSESLSAQPLWSAGLLFTYSIGLEPYCVQVSLPGPADIKIN